MTAESSGLRARACRQVFRQFDESQRPLGLDRRPRIQRQRPLGRDFRSPVRFQRPLGLDERPRIQRQWPLGLDGRVEIQRQWPLGPDFWSPIRFQRPRLSRLPYKSSCRRRSAEGSDACAGDFLAGHLRSQGGEPGLGTGVAGCRVVGSAKLPRRSWQERIAWPRRREGGIPWPASSYRHPASSRLC